MIAKVPTQQIPSTRNRSENKKFGEHEQIQMEKAGERKNRKA